MGPITYSVEGVDVAATDARRPMGRVAGWFPVALVLLILGTAFAAFEVDLGARLGIAHEPAVAPEQVAAPPGLDLPEFADAAPVAAAAPTARPDAKAVRRAVAKVLRRKSLGPHVVAAVGTPDGRIWFDNGGDEGMPASLTKLVTGLAALESLGPDRVFRTSVVAGAGARDVVLVGGGDPFLAAEPDLSETAWPRRADLITLADHAAAALIADGRTSVRMRYDDSLFSGPGLNPRWPDNYFPDGVVAPISALWVEQGDRLDGWGHVEDPAMTAAQFFAARLRDAGIQVTGKLRRTTAAAEAPELAGVDSAPVWQIIEQVIAVSDNEGAEVLAHHVGLAEAASGSFAGGVTGVTAVLDRLGVPLDDAELYDGSGLSRDNLLSAETILGVLAAADERPELNAVLDGLPVAGFNGSMRLRLAESNPEGLGKVRAKTGTLTGVHGLAGTVVDLTGTVLTFVVFADRVPPQDTLAARAALDDFTAALAACTCS